MSHHSIVLGALDENQCRRLADLTVASDYPGVIGPDLTASWFTNRAKGLGLRFLDPESQQIYAISGEPRYPGSLGHARPATTEDASLLADWLMAFHQEAVPRDPHPSREELERAAGEDRFLFWIVNGQPVSMAGIVRRLKTSAAITGVYTPPELRARGYAGSVTAAIIERIYAEGRKIACLYANRGNPAPNRCYTKIGFRPVCESLHFHRISSVYSPPLSVTVPPRRVRRTSDSPEYFYQDDRVSDGIGAAVQGGVPRTAQGDETGWVVRSTA